MKWKYELLGLDLHYVSCVIKTMCSVVTITNDGRSAAHQHKCTHCLAAACACLCCLCCRCGEAAAKCVVVPKPSTVQHGQHITSHVFTWRSNWNVSISQICTDMQIQLSKT